MKILQEHILQQVVDGKQLAIKELYQYSFQLLMPICVRYHRNREDAKFALNLAFLKIVQNLSKTELKALQYDAWARRITTNTMIDEFRKKKRDRERVSFYDEDWQLENQQTFSTNEGAEKLDYDQLVELIQQLPEMTQMVFNLFVIDGFTHEEIAQKLDIPLGTSKWQLSRARQILQKKIEKLTIKSTKNELSRQRIG